MKIRLDKETAWKNGKSITEYWIWVDDKCVDMAHTEEEALQKYENVKANYTGSSKVILKEETI